jgi:hypothetical protein
MAVGVRVSLLLLLYVWVEWRGHLQRSSWNRNDVNEPALSLPGRAFPQLLQIELCGSSWFLPFA